jgi:hypothetical protein
MRSKGLRPWSGFVLFISFLFLSFLLLSSAAWGQSNRSGSTVKSGGDFSSADFSNNDFSNNGDAVTKVPTGVILVRGAWSSASDSVTPVPEDASVKNNVFSDKYFEMTYPLSADWKETYKGPPPSDTGRYVLAQLGSSDAFKGPARGSILITAQDMLFSPLPAANAFELINYSKDHLQADYKVEMPPTQTKIAGHSFIFFAYWSPVAELHWYVLATQSRCHTLQIVLSSRDTKLLESLVLDMSKIKLPAEAGLTGGSGGGDSPICMKDYASEANVIARVEPVFAEHRFNPVPVRIIVDRAGRVKHIHFLSAFPDQAKAITDAIRKWRFRPYVSNGQAAEVETGILFGIAPRRALPPTTLQATESAVE